MGTVEQGAERTLRAWVVHRHLREWGRPARIHTVHVHHLGHTVKAPAVLELEGREHAKVERPVVHDASEVQTVLVDRQRDWVGHPPSRTTGGPFTYTGRPLPHVPLPVDEQPDIDSTFTPQAVDDPVAVFPRGACPDPPADAERMEPSSAGVAVVVAGTLHRERPAAVRQRHRCRPHQTGSPAMRRRLPVRQAHGAPRHLETPREAWPARHGAIEHDAQTLVERDLDTPHLDATRVQRIGHAYGRTPLQEVESGISRAVGRHTHAGFLGRNRWAPLPPTGYGTWEER